MNINVARCWYPFTLVRNWGYLGPTYRYKSWDTFRSSLGIWATFRSSLGIWATFRSSLGIWATCRSSIWPQVWVTFRSGLHVNNIVVLHLRIRLYLDCIVGRQNSRKDTFCYYIYKNTLNKVTIEKKCV